MSRLTCVTLITLVVSCTSYARIIRVKEHSPSAFSIINRYTWGGNQPTAELTRIGFPVPFVAIHHTYQPDVCHTLQECKGAMRSMQNFHQNTNGWADIGYSFAVGGEGSVFEGRGWDTVGAHAIGVNSRSVGIALIGDFVSKLPSAKQMQGVKNLIALGIELGYIAPDYKLIGHRAVSATECPGEALYQEISTWDHFYDGEIVW